MNYGHKRISRNYDSVVEIPIVSKFLKTIATLLIILAFFATIGGVYFASTPQGKDAEERIAVILKAHKGTDTGSVPEKVGKAVVAIEDKRFYKHHGIDITAKLRALWIDTKVRETTQGGDTIPEQLANVLYLPEAIGDTTFNTKLRDMGMALKLSSDYSKDQVLEMYLNAIYYGDNQYGIAQASQAYFGKDPGRLDWAEASMLAGLPQAPSAYNPRQHFDKARVRQKEVLNALVSIGVLSQKDANEAYEELKNLQS